MNPLLKNKPVTARTLLAPVSMAVLVGAGISATSAQPGVIEEILVTAQKREQNSRSVPIALSVLDSQALQQNQIKSLPDVANQLANVEMFEDFTGSGQPTWIIRGVGLQDFNTNNTPAASVYLDESYQSSVVMGSAALFDIERVEVLKGPQGGLYGRNTTGGAVLLHSNRADPEAFSSTLNLSASRWETLRADGSVNLPIGERNAWRLAGQISQSSDAWQDSLVDGNHHGEVDSWDIRSWYHIDLESGLQIDWKVQGGSNQSEIMLGRSVGLYNNFGGFCDAMQAGQRDDENCLSFAGLNLVLQAQPNINEVSLQSPDGASTLSDAINQQDNDYLSSTWLVEYAFDDFKLVSVTSFDEYNFGVSLDLDAATGEFAHRISSSEINLFSQEFRLVSNEGGNLTWLAGVNYSKEIFRERRAFQLRDNFLVFNATGLFLGNVDYDQETDMLALFGQMNYRLSDEWSMDLSLRYTDEEKTYRDGNLYVPIDPPVYLYQGLARDYSLDHNWTGGIGLNWQPADDLFIFGKLSQAYKSGGFYGGFPFFEQEIDPYAEELITAYELGIKTALPDYRINMNASVFYYDYQDVQGFVTRPNELTGSLIDVLTNQGDAYHKGAELEINWFPADFFALDMSLAWLEAKFKSDGTLTSDIGGNQYEITGRRAFAPELSATLGANFYWDFASGIETTSRLFYAWRSDRTGHRYSQPEYGVYRLDPYGTLDGSIEFTGFSDNFTVSVWGRNLTDVSYLTRVKSDGLNGFSDFYGQPRSIGVDLRFQW